MNLHKSVPVLIILVSYTWGHSEYQFIFSEEQNYWSIYNLDKQAEERYAVIEDRRDSSAHAYDNIGESEGLTHNLWILDTAMTDWPLLILNHTSSVDGVMNLERKLVNTFEHPILPKGHCYDYEMRYDGRIQITDSTRTLHHVWCDAPPEMTERQRTIYNRKLVHYPELLTDSIEDKPVILIWSWIQKQEKGHPPVVIQPIYTAQIQYDTLDMNKYKQQVIDEIKRLRATAE